VNRTAWNPHRPQTRAGPELHRQRMPGSHRASCSSCQAYPM
jgi:hypothetical protein